MAVLLSQLLAHWDRFCKEQGLPLRIPSIGLINYTGIPEARQLIAEESVHEKCISFIMRFSREFVFIIYSLRNTCCVLILSSGTKSKTVFLTVCMLIVF